LIGIHANAFKDNISLNMAVDVDLNQLTVCLSNMKTYENNKLTANQIYTIFGYS
jgi:hypothetical protein